MTRTHTAPTAADLLYLATQPTDGHTPDTPERHELLHGKGYFVVRGILSEDDRQAIRERLRMVCRNIDYYRQHIDLIKEVPDEALRNHPDPLLRFTWVNEIGFRDEVLWERCAAHPKLLEVARKVVGETIYPMNGGGFFLKPPRSQSTVPWHQDASPFRIPPEDGQPRNPLVFDYWLGIDAATSENGCLQLVPGSQKLGRLEHHDKGGVFPELEHPTQYGFSESDIVSIPLEAGDLLVWHQDMMHYSDPNRSDHQRIGKASVYMSGPQEQEVRQRLAKREPNMGINRRRPALCLNGKIQPLRPDAIIHPPESGG
ncbi:MAG: phytanoyl-CoA dioxygenase family protein [Phycisphaeraceae bacterium]|nr:phytanoyl-CoA dioxygenase family protein [Phycisphaeraceae bacterium]